MRLGQIRAGTGVPDGTTVVVQGGRLVTSDTATVPLRLPGGTTAQRPASPTVGTIRWNTDVKRIEWWTGSTWEQGGAGRAAFFAYRTSSLTVPSFSWVYLTFDTVNLIDSSTFDYNTTNGFLTVKRGGNVLFILKVHARQTGAGSSSSLRTSFAIHMWNMTTSTGVDTLANINIEEYSGSWSDRGRRTHVMTFVLPVTAMHVFSLRLQTNQYDAPAVVYGTPGTVFSCFGAVYLE